MEPNQILKSDFLDILFEGKNKAYGAYDLRKTYNRRMAAALIFTVALLLVVIVATAIANNIKPSEEPKEMLVKESILQQVQPEEPPPVIPPKIVPPVQQVQEIQFTTTKIVKDKDVINPPPEMKQIEDAQISTKTVEGPKDMGIVAPPSAEIGTNIIAEPIEKKDDNDKVYYIVEREASYPGGLGAWKKYVTKTVLSDIDEFSESDYGTCIVSFIVNREGVVSDVQATTMKGSKLAQIAVNAIRKGPNWIPAEQNGSKVISRKLQPVTLQNPDN